MTFGAIFASLLAAIAASDGTADAAPAPTAIAAPAPDAPPPEDAAPRDEPQGSPAVAAGADGSAEAIPNALAEAARVVLTASEAGTPIVIAPGADLAPDASSPPGDGSVPAQDAAAADPAAAAAPPPLPVAPAGPPLSSAAPVLLDRVEAADGWATERLIEPSGDIVLHTVNAAGTVQVCETVGSLLALALVEQRPASGGEFVHVARDASGALVSYAVGTDGEPRAVSLVAPPPR